MYVVENFRKTELVNVVIHACLPGSNIIGDYVI